MRLFGYPHSNSVRPYNPSMLIGDRIRALREAKNLSQGDIEKRSGLVRPYLSRIENCHTIPSLETLEKLARALEVPLYQLFYEEKEPPKLLNLPERKTAEEIAWGRVRCRSALAEQIAKSLRSNEGSEAKAALRCGSKNGQTLVGYRVLVDPGRHRLEGIFRLSLPIHSLAASAITKLAGPVRGLCPRKRHPACSNHDRPSSTL